MDNVPIREKIVLAATEVIYKRGYHDAKISEISDIAGINSSVIYRYFRGKEDLLFSIPLDKSIQFFEKLGDDLQGIEGSENLLRKLTWSLLQFYELNPKYAIILLMECRANKSFYKTEAYSWFRRLSKLFLSIFEEGKKEGRFSADVNSFIVRDLFFGAIDYSLLDCLVLKEGGAITDDFQGIFQLIQNMSSLQNSKDNGKRAKRDLLLDAAMEVFGEKGYYEATISQIAKKALVSDGTVYEYFENKEDLLFSISARKLEEDIGQLREMFSIKDPRRKLRRFIKHHCNLYLYDRNYLKTFLVLIQTNRRFYKSPAGELFKRYRNFLRNIIEEGQQNGFFIPEIESRLVTNIILGGLTHVFLRWMIVAKVSELDKMKEIEEVTDLLSSSIST